MEIKARLWQQAKDAQAAARRLAATRTAVKNEALLAMAEALTDEMPEILAANDEDWEAARRRGMKNSFLDRLHLDEGRIKAMADGLRQTAALPDPVGEGIASTVRPNGLEIRQVRVPLGVVGIIYEARPNVTADAVGLCLKSGNAVLLRGGSEALRSNRTIARLLARAMKRGFPMALSPL